MGLRVVGVVFDCAGPASLARFWAAALGYAVRPYSEADLDALRRLGIDDVEDDPSVAVDGPRGDPTLWFQRVPEGKVAKNRVHLELLPDGSLEDELERLRALGARLHESFDEDGRRWAVMLDPEGNEFCVQAPS